MTTIDTYERTHGRSPIPTRAFQEAFAKVVPRDIREKAANAGWDAGSRSARVVLGNTQNCPLGAVTFYAHQVMPDVHWESCSGSGADKVDQSAWYDDERERNDAIARWTENGLYHEGYAISGYSKIFTDLAKARAVAPMLTSEEWDSLYTGLSDFISMADSEIHGKDALIREWFVGLTPDEEAALVEHDDATIPMDVSVRAVERAIAEPVPVLVAR